MMDESVAASIRRNTVVVGGVVAALLGLSLLWPVLFPLALLALLFGAPLAAAGGR